MDTYDRIFMETLGVDRDALGEGLTFAATPEWDSLAHMELVAALGEYMPRISPTLEAPWQCLSGRGLYDLTSGTSGRYDGCYHSLYGA